MELKLAAASRGSAGAEQNPYGFATVAEPSSAENESNEVRRMDQLGFEPKPDVLAHAARDW